MLAIRDGLKCAAGSSYQSASDMRAGRIVSRMPQIGSARCGSVRLGAAWRASAPGRGFHKPASHLIEIRRDRLRLRLRLRPLALSGRLHRLQ